MKFLIKTKCGETLISDCDEVCEQTGCFAPIVFEDMITFGNVGVHKDNLLYYMPYEELKANTLKCDNMDIDDSGNVNFKCNENNTKEKIYVNGVDVEELKKYHEELLSKSNEMTVKELARSMSRKIREMQERGI